MSAIKLNVLSLEYAMQQNSSYNCNIANTHQYTPTIFTFKILHNRIYSATPFLSMEQLQIARNLCIRPTTCNHLQSAKQFKTSCLLEIGLRIENIFNYHYINTWPKCTQIRLRIYEIVVHLPQNLILQVLVTL